MNLRLSPHAFRRRAVVQAFALLLPLVAARKRATIRERQLRGYEMASEQELKGLDFTGTANAALGTATMANASKGQPKWVRWLVGVFAVITVLAAGAGLIDKLVNINSLPACDGKRTKDTLSDLNKKNQVNASAYNFIKETAKSENEIRCVANLALRAGGTLEYDYRIFRDGSGMKVEITEMRR